MKKPRLTDVPGHQSHMVHCPVWEKRRQWHWLRGGEVFGLGRSEFAQGHMGLVCKSPCWSGASPGSLRTGSTQRLPCQSWWGPEPRGGRGNRVRSVAARSLAVRGTRGGWLRPARGGRGTGGVGRSLPRAALSRGSAPGRGGRHRRQLKRAGAEKVEPPRPPPGL